MTDKEIYEEPVNAKADIDDIAMIASVTANAVIQRMKKEVREETIQRQESQSSLEFGPANRRAKVYFWDVAEAKSKVDELFGLYEHIEEKEKALKGEQ